MAKTSLSERNGIVIPAIVAENTSFLPMHGEKAPVIEREPHNGTRNRVLARMSTMTPRTLRPSQVFWLDWIGSYEDLFGRASAKSPGELIAWVDFFVQSIKVSKERTSIQLGATDKAKQVVRYPEERGAIEFADGESLVMTGACGSEYTSMSTVRGAGRLSLSTTEWLQAYTALDTHRFPSTPAPFECPTSEELQSLMVAPQTSRFPSVGNG